ncbi:preprotein translocase subunit SecE [Solimonas marina]|uniref:Preprotein translocase subunit SecE n=1 Tax=Solimonas marina TaxID=2714601 RepID=A0A969W9A4_9GAMM|nr:preprotein translocase subunit SecE [Solimonas marina]NKF22722.1 preprotein translocase subunit SecE [Solimonas marina]
MEAQHTEKAGSAAKDTALLIIAAIVLIGGMFAFYYFEGQLNALVRTLMILGAFAATLALAYQTALGRDLWGYVSGARIEMRKVVWPTRQEAVQTTLMIVIVVAVMALLIAGLDWVLLRGVELLTGRGA